MESENKKDGTKNGACNIVTNLNNQANIVDSNDVLIDQVNSVFILVSPYYLKQFSLEGLDIDLNIDQNGSIFVNNKEYDIVEVKPGVKMFGIIKR